MSSKPPRLDLAAAMEAELETDALGPRSVWGTPPALQTSSHETSVTPASAPSVTPHYETHVASTPVTPVPLNSATTGASGYATEGAEDDATDGSPSDATTGRSAAPGAGAQETKAALSSSPMRQADHATTVTSPPQDRLTKRSYQPPSRQGAVRISAYCSPRVMKQIRMLAVTQDTTIDDLVTRALDLLFRAEGLPAIAFDGKPFGRASQSSETGPDA